jgi:hypothetical protein
MHRLSVGQSSGIQEEAGRDTEIREDKQIMRDSAVVHVHGGKRIKRIGHQFM